MRSYILYDSAEKSAPPVKQDSDTQSSDKFRRQQHKQDPEFTQKNQLLRLKAFNTSLLVGIVASSQGSSNERSC